MRYGRHEPAIGALPVPIYAPRIRLVGYPDGDPSPADENKAAAKRSSREEEERQENCGRKKTRRHEYGVS